MISEANFNNLQTLRRAAKEDELALMACRLKATGATAAVVAAVQPDGNNSYSFVPFGMLDGVAGLVTAEARLTDLAREEHTKLVAALKSTVKQAWMAEQDGRVSVRFSKDTPRAADGCVLVLAWDDPYELFEPPVLN